MMMFCRYGWMDGLDRPRVTTLIELQTEHECASGRGIQHEGINASLKACNHSLTHSPRHTLTHTLTHINVSLHQPTSSPSISPSISLPAALPSPALPSVSPLYVCLCVCMYVQASIRGTNNRATILNTNRSTRTCTDHSLSTHIDRHKGEKVALMAVGRAGGREGERGRGRGREREGGRMVAGQHTLLHASLHTRNPRNWSPAALVTCARQPARHSLPIT